MTSTTTPSERKSTTSPPLPSSPSDTSNKTHLQQKRSLQEEPPVKERKSRKAPHELLTDAEKKANHIASEQKRRQNIRLGFDQLIEIVPALNTGNRSEALILQKSVDHIKQLISVKNDLKEQIRDLQALLGESPYDEDSSEDDLAYSAY
ncbi:uncharacterized protein BX664DRAFT_329684 [Halteromyces radiatus]|uniref:uncharacterized protein n=1 Tax=Halteromyces radiatus TaxID=101107 RepID=UPI00221E6999|nr:uncharacterized protein BX664DRAFT_329684 [Halteromyces radiatus]KAI8093427.1 hypothetical protein BX664DRAFT_329684 [Halteromyces radiatus]